MQNYLFKQISIVNEGNIEKKDIYIKKGRIERIGNNINIKERASEINGEDNHLLPGIIDDQVHYREPGLTHKATIYTESKAAVAGGITSFMEMPNTIPNALTAKLLEDKYDIARQNSLANYSFYMGSSNTNADEVFFHIDVIINSFNMALLYINIFFLNFSFIDNWYLLKKIILHTLKLIN